MASNPDPRYADDRRPPQRRLGCFRSCLLMFLLPIFIIVGAAIGLRLGGGNIVLGDSVGVVRIEGTINESRRVVKLIRQMAENDSIRAVVLRIDSPGGAVGASEEIAREVTRLRTGAKKKPVIVSMGNAAASGGYYIACAADMIYANSGTITGSIGVLAPGINMEQTLSKIGIYQNTIKSGEHKDTGSPLREMSPEERRLIQGVVYDTYRQFFSAVLKGRHTAIERALQKNPGVVDEVIDTSGTKRAGNGIEWDAFTTGTIATQVGATVATETALRHIADGRVITGDQAFKLGLVDKIGTQQDAIEEAARLGHITGKPRVVEREPDTELPAWLGVSARQALDAFQSRDFAVEYR